MSPSPMQLLIVGAIVVLLFGARRFSDLGKGLGEGIRNFKKGVAEEDTDEKKTPATEVAKDTSSDKSDSSSDA